MNLSKYKIYLKQLIDGMPSAIFSAGTFPPYPKDDEIFVARYKKILSVSREKYSKDRKMVEGKINKTMSDLEKQEDAWEKKKDDYKQKEKETKAKKHQDMLVKQAENKKDDIK